MLKVKTLRLQNNVIDFVVVSFLLTLNIFYKFFSVSIHLFFEQVNVFWDILMKRLWTLFTSYVTGFIYNLSWQLL